MEGEGRKRKVGGEEERSQLDSASRNAAVEGAEPVITSTNKKPRRGDQAEASDFDLNWERYGEFEPGLPTTVHQFVGSTEAVYLCDEVVDPSLVARGLHLLEALAPPDQAEGKDEDYEHDEEEEEEDSDGVKTTPFTGQGSLPPIQTTSFGQANCDLLLSPAGNQGITVSTFSTSTFGNVQGGTGPTAASFAPPPFEASSQGGSASGFVSPFATLPFGGSSQSGWASSLGGQESVTEHPLPPSITTRVTEHPLPPWMASQGKGNANVATKAQLPSLPPLPPLDIAVGEWRFDAEATEERLALITARKARAGVDPDGNGFGEEQGRAWGEGEPRVMVYRASATINGQVEQLQKDRFEVTHVFHKGDSREYVFVVDKVERRFVFVGEDGSHPHCGTNEFIYDNSDGCGPGFYGRLSKVGTIHRLLQAARRRFVRYCKDEDH